MAHPHHVGFGCQQRNVRELDSIVSRSIGV
jgi:hypothetical protein